MGKDVNKEERVLLFQRVGGNLRLVVTMPTEAHWKSKNSAKN